MAFGTLLWESVILTSVALLLRDITGIASAPRYWYLESCKLQLAMLKKPKNRLQTQKDEAKNAAEEADRTEAAN